MCRCSVRTRAFTLIELLVVLGIIGLLLSILLPALQGARRLAREVKCGAQLREYAVGFQYYLGEYREVFPAADYGIGTDTIYAPTWYQLIESYWLGGLILDEEADRKRGEDFGLGRCPALAGPHSTNGIDWEWSYSWNSFGYGYNRFWLGWNIFDRQTVLPEQTLWRRLRTVIQPSECVLVGDSCARILRPRPRVGPVSHYVGWWCMASRGSGFDTRHGAMGKEPTVPFVENGKTALYRSGKANIAWVDGHVSARTSPQINDKFEWRHLWDPTRSGEP